VTRVRGFVREHGYVAAGLAVVCATILLAPLRFYVDFAHLAWLYLCAVGLVAWLSGTGPALLAAVLSFAAGTYFTPPVGAFWVSDPLDYIPLGVFLAGAAGVGTLTGQVRRRDTAALESEREATALARLASEMAEGRDLDSVVDSAISCLIAQRDVATVVVWMAEPGNGLVAYGSSDQPGDGGDKAVAARAFDRMISVNLSDSAREADPLGSGSLTVQNERGPEGVGTFIPLVSSSGNEGVLQVTGQAAGLSEGSSSLAVAISHLLAIFISSERAVQTAARVQGAEEAARVKSVIVSAVSHELKTPLAAAIAGVTDLVAEDVTRDSADVGRVLNAVADDLQRLQTAIADLLDLSRLQAEEWMTSPELYEAGEILGDVAASASPALRDRMVFRVSEAPAPDVYADFAQVSRALRAILDNAVVYSPPTAPIFLGAERRGDRTMVWIEDRGPGVPDEDKPFVFDRAYRGRAGVRRPGSTGLGLTIARDLVEANAGRLRVEDASPTGTRIVADLPASPNREAYLRD